MLNNKIDGEPTSPAVAPKNIASLDPETLTQLSNLVAEMTTRTRINKKKELKDWTDKTILGGLIFIGFLEALVVIIVLLIRFNFVEGRCGHKVGLLRR